MSQKPQTKFFPFLYVLMFFIVMYSVNDMATSTNAYQAQGDRSIVYVALIGIIGVLGLYVLLRWIYFGLNFIAPTGSFIALTFWIAFDNLMLGNIITSSNMWSSFTHIGLSAWWLLTLLFGYYYPRNNPNKQKQLMIFIIVMLFYYSWQFILVLIESNTTLDQTAVLNLIYRVVVFVPALYLLENKKLRNVLLFAIFIMTIASMKRGAIIILPIMMLVYYFIENRDDKNMLKKMMRIVLIVLALILAFFIADAATGGFLSFRFSLEELMYGSSRSDKYASAIAEFKERDFFGKMFGIGSSHRSGVHNEVLEFLYSFGIVGLVIYLMLITSMIVRFANLYRARSKYASTYAIIVVFFIVVGLYSGVYFTHSTFYLTLVMGQIESRVREEQINEKNSDNHLARGQLRSNASIGRLK